MNKPDNIEVKQQRFQQRVVASMDRWLPKAATHPGKLHEAMRYAALNGGKRLRPVLIYATGETLGIALESLDGIAAAVELIHSYSLIHDDLPAMDNDDLRRGQPTCHKVFGEATAILAGDAMQALAFRILARDSQIDISAETRLQLIETLAMACGSRGMAGGQAIDLASVGQTLDIAELEDMHVHKTGALIRASVMMSAMCSKNLETYQRDRLDQYGKYIGLAFQIRDDILDVEGETQVLGKKSGADHALDKPTYPALLGLEGARQRARELYQAALDVLQPLGQNADPLRTIAQYIVERIY